MAVDARPLGCDALGLSSKVTANMALPWLSRWPPVPFTVKVTNPKDFANPNCNQSKHNCSTINSFLCNYRCKNQNIHAFCSCFYPKIQSKSDPWGLAYYCFVQPLSLILQTQCHYFSYLVTYRLIHVANASKVRLFGPTHSDDLVKGSSDFFPMHWKYTQTMPRHTGIGICYLHFFAVFTKESVIQPQIYVVQPARWYNITAL